MMIEGIKEGFEKGYIARWVGWFIVKYADF